MGRGWIHIRLGFLFRPHKTLQNSQLTRRAERPMLDLVISLDRLATLASCADRTVSKTGLRSCSLARITGTLMHPATPFCLVYYSTTAPTFFAKQQRQRQRNLILAIESEPTSDPDRQLRRYCPTLGSSKSQECRRERSSMGWYYHKDSECRLDVRYRWRRCVESRFTTLVRGIRY